MLHSSLISAHTHDDRYYTETEIDAFFEGEVAGKKQVHWDRVTNKPSVVESFIDLDDVPAGYETCGGKHLRVKSTEDGLEWITPGTDHNHDARYYTKTLLDAGQLDTRYYTETEIDAKLLDIKITSVQDGDLLVYDAEANGGKWINSTEIPSHSHNHAALTWVCPATKELCSIPVSSVLTGFPASSSPSDVAMNSVSLK
ncbi:hypothetical protein ES703_113089 [subsurface metagenome]